MQSLLRVLLVEDSQSDARLIREQLNEQLMETGFELDWADTLLSGASLARSASPDVVLLDLSLPDCEGLETFRTLHAQSPQLPIVVLTVLEEQELAITAVGEGAQDYLVKGQVDAHQLLQSLRYAVERQRLILDLRQAKEAAEAHSLELTGYYRQMEAALEQVREAVSRERESLRRMQELDRLKNEFLAIFAHDLRNSTHVIRAFSQILVDRWDALPEQKRRSYASTVLRGSTNLAKLIENVLQYARLEEGSFRAEVHVMDLRQLVVSTVEEVAGPEERLHISIHAPPHLPLVLADERRQWQVLANLLGNAQKFSPPGRPIEVELRHREQEGLVEVRVRDHGRGMAPEDVPRLFRKFSRLPGEQGGRAPVPGTGLGLYICKRLVEAQGGTIWVKSQPGQGSTFAYTVPVASPQRSVGEAPAERGV